MKRWMQHLSLCVLICLTAACAGPEAKLEKFMDRGRTLYDQGEYVNARLEFKNAIQIDPESAPAYFLLGKTELALKQGRAAHDRFKRAIELDPDLVEARLLLGKLYLAGRAFDRAGTTADALLKRVPHHVDARLLKAAVLLATGLQDDADRMMTRLFESGIRTKDLYAMLATSAERRQDFDTAAQLLKEGLIHHPDALGLMLRLAELEVRNANWEQVISLFRRAVELAPEDHQHRFNLAKAYMNHGNRPGAEKTIYRVLAENPEDEALLIQGARFWLEGGGTAAAETLVAAGIRKNPESLPLRMFLADLYVRTQRLDEARTTLTQALVAGPDPSHPSAVRIRTALARVLVLQGRTDDGENQVNSVLADDPGNVDAHYVKGRIHLARQEGVLAVPEFRIVTEERPRSVQAWLNLAQAHVLNGETELSMAVLNQGLDHNPDALFLVSALVRAHLRDNDPAAAIRICKDRLAKNQDEALTWNMLGAIHLKNHAFDRAGHAFEQAVRVRPGWGKPYGNLARLYLAQGRRAAAVRKLETALARNPGDSTAWMVLANIHETDRSYDAAAQAYEQAFACNGKLWAAANNAAFIRTEFASSPADLDAALAHAEKAMALNPDDGAVQDTMGWLLYKRGNLAGAREHIQKALERNPDEAVINFHYGVILGEQGDQSRATEFLDKSLARGSDFPGADTARKLLAQLHAGGSGDAASGGRL